MANFQLSNPGNRAGPLFVDTTCIDCGTCFHLGPGIFAEQAELSVVTAQPVSGPQWAQARAAIISCPTQSIGVRAPPAAFREAEDLLPLQISDGIYYCGYTARASFGATSYLVRRPDGNILVDSPRFHPQLVKKLEELGGVSWMFLSHQDDVADHQQFADHFHCQRIIHEKELQAGTSGCEQILRGEGDWELADDLSVIFTPGHTAGHLCLLYKHAYLFTGDHLFYSPVEDQLYASKSVNWFSWTTQLQSMGKLLDRKFEWILPGHGGWVHKSESELKTSLRRIIEGQGRPGPVA